MPIQIELSSLTRQYGDRPGVRDLTLSIEAGEILGLVGANGAGKSTTLKMLATLLLPSGGWGRVAGYDLVREADAVRRNIGYVPEGAELYETLSGTEFLDLMRDLHRLPIGLAEARRTPLLQAFALDAHVERVIADYSKGMKQKLLIVAALQHDPRVLLLDEPMDGLDVPAQECLKQVLRDRAAAGCTVIYSSHILEVVEQLCSRVAILVDHRLKALGSPRALLEQSGAGSLSRLFLRLTGDNPAQDMDHTGAPAGGFANTGAIADIADIAPASAS